MNGYQFTDNARRVFNLAHQESQRLGHGYLGTEHLLLGLIEVGGGTASEVLADLKVDTGKIRRSIEDLGQRVCNPIAVLNNLGVDVSGFGPEIEMLGQLKGNRIASGKLPQTPRAKNVVNYAKDEAQNLGHTCVGTEHILLGLLREQEAPAALVLMNHGLKLEAVRTKIQAFLTHRKHEGKE